MARPPIVYHDVHQAADHYEAVLQARAFRTLRALRDRVSIDDLAQMLSSGMHQHVGPVLLPDTVIEQVLSPLRTTIRDAVMKGGQLGADRLRTKRT